MFNLVILQVKHGLSVAVHTHLATDNVDTHLATDNVDTHLATDNVD